MHGLTANLKHAVIEIYIKQKKRLIMASNNRTGNRPTNQRRRKRSWKRYRKLIIINHL